MRQTTEKDLYSVLGVTPDTTIEEMRKAYLARARVIHPDRFDPQRQPQDWKKANEMLAELNEAWSILRDPSIRAEYDRLRADKQQSEGAPPPTRSQSAPPEQSPPPGFELGELTAGQAAFGSLPENVQERLLKRQENKGEDQFQVKLSSVMWNYIFIVILLCWYWYLFAAADGPKWKDSTLLWYTATTLAVGCLIGRNCITIRRWAKAKLKSYFYVTPIYFIKTEFDVVSFRPIWTLKDVAVTHNYKNGSYQNSDVVLKFDGYNESLSLSSKGAVQALLNRIRDYDARLRSAYANCDHGYFVHHDDFYRVPRSGVPTPLLLGKRQQAFIYAVCIVVCGLGLIAAIGANAELSRYTPRPAPSVVMPSYPEQSMPYSGAIRTWTSAERIAPFEIKAAPGRHHVVKLVNAYTRAPVLTVFVRGGTTVQVEVPLGTYEVRYASGETWYGYEYLFGPQTSYSKADKTFTFQVIGNQISGFTITLYKVPHGNLHTSPIQPTDF